MSWKTNFSCGSALLALALTAMKTIRKFIIWSLIFIGLLLACDLLLVRSQTLPPGLAAVQRFYVDFRGRILNLAGQAPADTIERVIEKAASSTEPVKTGNRQPAGQRYLYADAQGALHFADSLAEVPRPYRDTAQPLQD